MHAPDINYGLRWDWNGIGLDRAAYFSLRAQLGAEKSGKKTCRVTLEINCEHFVNK